MEPTQDYETVRPEPDEGHFVVRQAHHERSCFTLTRRPTSAYQLRGQVLNPTFHVDIFDI